MNSHKKLVFATLTVLTVVAIRASSTPPSAPPHFLTPPQYMSIKDLEKQVSSSDKILSLEYGYGNKNFLFYTDGWECRFRRLAMVDLSNNITFPEGIEKRLRSGSLNIQQYQQDGLWVLGNKEFAVICNEKGENELASFSNEASLNDLCRFTQRLYNSVVSKQIVDSHEMSAAYRALVELCIQVALERIKVTCMMFATGISCRTAAYANLLMLDEYTRQRAGNQKCGDVIMEYELPTNSETQYKYCYEIESSRERLMRCCVNTLDPIVDSNTLSGWSTATKHIIRGAYINQLDQIFRRAAFRYGELFSGCNRSYLLKVILDIKENGATDIRKSGYERALIDLSSCEKASDLWNDIHRNEYLTVAAHLMRINREILVAVRDKQYEEGFEELSLLADKWRPVMRWYMRNYHYLFSDLPVVLASHRAFAIAFEADAFWSVNKDRKAAAGAAHQWARFCANGKVCHYLRSNYSSDIMTQYHGFLKKMLGNDTYKSLETTLKTSTDREKEEFPDKL